MKYRKLPIIIDAFQFDGDFMNRDGAYYIPEWAISAFENDVMEFQEMDLYINTLEGKMSVSVGDYIIKGVNDELYPCKPDIFEKTYERID